MRYALLAYARPGAFAALTDEERAAWEADDAAFNAEITDRGYVVSGEQLAEADIATTVRIDNGIAMLTDGPFADVTEHLGGFLVIDVPDLDTALDLARRCPAARTGPLEVRPIRM
jgi:hypothetical protein